MTFRLLQNNCMFLRMKLSIFAAEKQTITPNNKKQQDYDKLKGSDKTEKRR